MWTTCFKRVESNEVIIISDYSFEWFKDDKLIKIGLVENKEKDIEMLIEEGFVVVE